MDDTPQRELEESREEGDKLNHLQGPEGHAEPLVLRLGEPRDVLRGEQGAENDLGEVHEGTRGRARARQTVSLQHIDAGEDQGADELQDMAGESVVALLGVLERLPVGFQLGFGLRRGDGGRRAV